MRTIGPWIRYARHLPPRKIIGRLRFEVKVRTMPLALSRSGSDAAQPAHWQHLADFWDAYAPLGERFVDAQRLYDGVFVSKGVEYDFGSPENVVVGNPFGDPSFEHWEHDLSFFTFLLPLASVDPGRAAQLGSVLVDRVEATTVLRLGQRPSFVNAPIALSIRIMALGAVLGAVAQISHPAPKSDLARIAAQIRRSEALLRWTLEKHLGFNHLVFGAAALAVAEVTRGVPPISARLAARELERRLCPRPGWVLAIVATLPFFQGGRVVVESSCEEGSGPSSDVCEAPAVHGAAWSGLEHPWRREGGRHLSVCGRELGSRVQGLPRRPGRRVRSAAGSAGGEGGQRSVPVPGRTRRDR